MILLDTHALLWLSSDPAKLSSNAKTAIEDARKNKEGIAVSDITLLELATMANQMLAGPGTRVAIGSW